MKNQHPSAIEAASTQGESSSAACASATLTNNAFAALGLADELLQAITEMGYTQPTEVQRRAIPLALQKAESSAQSNYVDLMVSSQTGSGKTAAFLLPVLHTLIEQTTETKAAEKAEFERKVAQALARGEEPPRKPKRKNPLNRKFTAAEPAALVLCPTRELAMQVAKDAIDLIQRHRGIRIGSVIGGLPYPKQIAQLSGAKLVVATPGRLLDLQRSGQIKLEGVKFLVLDEADRMLDLGFADDLEEISALTANRRQTMMFSATFAPRIQKLAMSVMHEGGKFVQKIEIATPQVKHENITQKLFWADTPEHKRELLDAWLRTPEIDQAIVFASTQVECDELASDLQQAGFSAVALHGALGQGMRMRRLAALRTGRVKILVATDVAARGIDVPAITHVFNYGLPMKAEDYTHRIGRTGRAGREGLAVTFAEYRDRRRIFDIENFTRQKFVTAVFPGLEPRQRVPEWRSDKTGHRGKGHGPGHPNRQHPKNKVDHFGSKGFGNKAFGERSFDSRDFGEKNFNDKGFSHKRFDGERSFGDKRQRRQSLGNTRPEHGKTHRPHAHAEAGPGGNTRHHAPRSQARAFKTKESFGAPAKRHSGSRKSGSR